MDSPAELADTGQRGRLLLDLTTWEPPTTPEEKLELQIAAFDGLERMLWARLPGLYRLQPPRSKQVTPGRPRKARARERRSGRRTSGSPDDADPESDPLAPRQCRSCEATFIPKRSSSFHCRKTECQRARKAENQRDSRSRRAPAPDPLDRYRAKIRQLLQSGDLTPDEALDLLACDLQEARQRVLQAASPSQRSEVAAFFAVAA